MKINRLPLTAVAPLILAGCLAVLAGCGGGGGGGSSSTPVGANIGNVLPTVPSGGNTGGGATGGNTSACTTAPALFTSSVGPSIGSICATCHIQGGLAGGTPLVFTAGGATVANYNVLRAYVMSSSGGASKLLGRTIGQPSHGGGSPYVDANSQAYKDMQTLLGEIVQNCSTGGGTASPAGAFFQGVNLTDNTTALTRAAVLFAGRNPTTDEVNSVSAGGDAALRGTIRAYMTGTTFDRFLLDASDTWFLTPGVTVFGTGGLDAKDWPSAALVINNDKSLAAGVRGRFSTSIRREPIELVKFIVKNDRPWTEMVSGNYTVVNGLLNQYLTPTMIQGAFKDPTDDNEWIPATLPSERLGGNREHAGVLSTHAWLNRVPTTPTNRNRHRVNILMQQFLATNITAMGMRPLAGSTSPFKVPTLQDPACTGCHDAMDPIAAGFQNWNENNRFLPVHTGSGKDIALPDSYRSGNYPKDASNMAYYQDGDNWFRDDQIPGYKGSPMPGGYMGNPTALQWTGMQIASDPQFPLGGVYFWFPAIFGRQPLAAPTDPTSPQYAAQLAAYNAQSAELQSIAAKFATNRGNGPYNVRDLLVDLVLSNWFRAQSMQASAVARAQELSDVGSQNLLLPAQLSAKVNSLLGVTFGDFNNPYAGAALNYGDFDGRTRTIRSKSYTMIQTTTIERMEVTLSCNATQQDFGKLARTRLLFPLVEMSATPDAQAGLDAITANIVYLHKWLLKETLPSSDPEIQRTLKLFTDVWNDRATASPTDVACSLNNGNDPTYTGRAWAAVVAYLIGDDKFLYE